MELRDALTQTRDYLTAQIAAMEPPDTVVKNAMELRAALKRGGVIQLAAGTYVGNFNLDADHTTVVGSREAILAPEDQLEPTVWAIANDLRAEGFTVVNGAPDRECIVVGRFAATDVSQQPFRVTLEGLAVTAGAKGGHRGISLHGVDLRVRKCEITNFTEVGRDSQGVWICNGPGPYEVTDNLIEASGENILFGGADPMIQGCVPSDALIARNRLRKPLSFGLNRISNKNAFEIKNGRRVTFADNLIEIEVLKLIQASAIQLTPRNQDGTAEWSTVEDVSIVRNIVTSKAPGFAVNILGTDDEQISQQMRNVDIAGNLFRTTAGFQILGGIEGYLDIRHNTLPDIKTKLFSFDRNRGVIVPTPLSYTNNVAKAGTYAVTGDGEQSFGLPSLLAYTEIKAWFGNVVENGSQPWPWPEGQTVLVRGALDQLLNPTTKRMLNGTAGY